MGGNYGLWVWMWTLCQVVKISGQKKKEKHFSNFYAEKRCGKIWFGYWLETLWRMYREETCLIPCHTIGWRSCRIHVACIRSSYFLSDFYLFVCSVFEFLSRIRFYFSFVLVMCMVWCCTKKDHIMWWEKGNDGNLEH